MTDLIQPRIGDVRPIDPRRPEGPFCEPAQAWEVYTDRGWVNLAIETMRISRIEGVME